MQSRELTELLESLSDTKPDPASYTDESHITVYVGDEKVELSGRDVALVLQNDRTAAQFVEAATVSMGPLDDANIEVSDYEIDDCVLGVLNQSFLTVDEV